MKLMSKQEMEARQRWAYENRDSIRIGDLISLKCTEADEALAHFAIPGDEIIMCQKPGKIIRKGYLINLFCFVVSVGYNALGPFVDYMFQAAETGHTVILDGPSAQELAGKRLAPVTVRNRDIPVLAEVASIMQTVCQIEKRRDWQHERRFHITQNVTGMPGGGGLPKGLDDALALLDEIDREQVQECREYARQLRQAQRILNGIHSQSMRTFVEMKYVMGCTNREIRQELNMTRRGFERARRNIEDAPDMAAVKWQERYVVEGE